MTTTSVIGASVTFRRAEDSGIDDFIRKLKERAEALPRETAEALNTEAMLTAPIYTGLLKEDHKVYRTGTYAYKQRVDSEYGVYVNYGTRHMAAQPWWSQAVAKHRRIFSARAREMLK